MTRIEKILKNARMVLADKDSERWTDEDLLSILDEGHKDLCQHSQILKGRVVLPLSPGNPYFVLPENCWMLTRVTYDNEVLPFVTHTQMDGRKHPSFSGSRPTIDSVIDWETETGEPEAIIYDRRNMNEARVYPIPEADETTEAFSSVFGVVTAIDDPATSAPNQPMGVAVEEDGTPSLKCYYLQKPEDIIDITDELATPMMFDTALKYYVIGNAFLMDIAEEYQAKGLQQLGFYNRELELANKTTKVDHVQGAAGRTMYRTGF